MNKSVNQALMESGVDVGALTSYVERKCCRYAVKHGWEDAYKAEAVRFCLLGAAKAVVRARIKGDRICYPQRFAEYAAIQSLKHDRWGNLVIPCWKQEMRTGVAVIVTFADRKEAL